MRGLLIAALTSLLPIACDKPEDDKDLRMAFSTTLKDPGSLQFQRLHRTEEKICGEYNAKNSYGAYAGFEAFSFDRSSSTLMTESDARLRPSDYRKFLDSLTGCDIDNEIFYAMGDRLHRRVNETLVDLGDAD